MRMWMVDPAIMCRKHLLGEHVEHHMFVGSIAKGIDLSGYLDNNLLEPRNLQQRHEELVQEMKRRGYDHKSPLPSLCLDKYFASLLSVKINRQVALDDLLSRCPDCRARFDTIASGQKP